jgi:hypothetical protein
VPEITAFMCAHDVRVSKFRRFATSLRRKRGIEAAPLPLTELPKTAPEGPLKANGTAIVSASTAKAALPAGNGAHNLPARPVRH